MELISGLGLLFKMASELKKWAGELDEVSIICVEKIRQMMLGILVKHALRL